MAGTLPLLAGTTATHVVVTCFTSLEDTKRKQGRDKRAKNVVIQGLLIQNKTKEDTWECVTKDLPQSKLAIAMRQKEVKSHAYVPPASAMFIKKSWYDSEV